MSTPLRSAALLLGFCALVVVLRVTLSGMAEERQAALAERQERWHEACVHHGRALHMYLPGSPIQARAGARLLELADAAATGGEPWRARFCLEELRSGLLAVRSTWQPHRDLIAQAEERLVPLMLADERGAWPDPALPPAEREAAVRAVLAAREDPALPWVLVMGAGWLLWLGAAAMAILRGLPAADTAPVRWPVVLRWGLLSAAGYGLWVLGVALA